MQILRRPEGEDVLKRIYFFVRLSPFGGVGTPGEAVFNIQKGQVKKTAWNVKEPWLSGPSKGDSGRMRLFYDVLLNKKCAYASIA